jgi:hypothetical protein
MTPDTSCTPHQRHLLPEHARAGEVVKVQPLARAQRGLGVPVGVICGGVRVCVCMSFWGGGAGGRGEGDMHA